MKIVAQSKLFEGLQTTYSHHSEALSCDMNVAVFSPSQSQTRACPVVYYLSGLTCTEQNATTKAGAQRACADLGLILVCPDTSPRGTAIPDDTANDLGQGASFYVDATESPWNKHYRMETYITSELVALIDATYQTGKKSVMGHSMGGHGALTLALRHPELFVSASAFAPVCAPSQCPWGQKAFSAYLGKNRKHWSQHDATALIESGAAPNLPLMVDQGSVDEFLTRELMPEKLKAACQNQGRALDYRQRDGYDHSYNFIASFIDAHLAFHARHLNASA